MATLYRCDRCKLLTESKGDLREIRLPYMNKWNNAFTDEDDSYSREICIRCARELMETYNNVVTEEKK